MQAGAFVKSAFRKKEKNDLAAGERRIAAHGAAVRMLYILS